MNSLYIETKPSVERNPKLRLNSCFFPNRCMSISSCRVSFHPERAPSSIVASTSLSAYSGGAAEDNGCSIAMIGIVLFGDRLLEVGTQSRSNNEKFESWSMQSTSALIRKE